MPDLPTLCITGKLECANIAQTDLYSFLLMVHDSAGTTRSNFDLIRTILLPVSCVLLIVLICIKR